MARTTSPLFYGHPALLPRLSTLRNAPNAALGVGTLAPARTSRRSSILGTREENPFSGVFSTLPSSRDAPMVKEVAIPLVDAPEEPRLQEAPPVFYEQGSEQLAGLGGLCRHSSSPAAQARVRGEASLLLARCHSEFVEGCAVGGEGMKGDVQGEDLPFQGSLLGLRQWQAPDASILLP